MLPDLPCIYSADIVGTDGSRCRCYTNGIMKRQDDFVGKRVKSWMISRPDLGVVWSWDHGDTVFEIDVKKSHFELQFDPHTMYEWRKVEVNTYENRSIAIYHGKKITAIGTSFAECLVDQQTGMRIRMVVSRESGEVVSTTRWENISYEPPPLSLFELPAGMTVVRLPALL